jgi:hypothetical protein
VSGQAHWHEHWREKEAMRYVQTKLGAAVALLGGVLVPGVTSATDPCPATGPSHTFCEGSAGLKIAAQSLYTMAGYFFAAAFAPEAEINKLKTRFDHDNSIP